MKKILVGLFSGVLILTACAPAGTAPPVFVTQEAAVTPSPIPTSTNTSLLTATATASITPLPIIPTFTPTFDELIQPNPFLTDTPNPTAQVIAQKWNSKNFSLSPDGKWVAIIDFGILRIIQTQGEQEFTINCETFIECEFIIPLQWSPDSHKLYVVPLLDW